MHQMREGGWSPFSRVLRLIVYLTKFDLKQRNNLFREVFQVTALHIPLQVYNLHDLTDRAVLDCDPVLGTFHQSDDLK